MRENQDPCQVWRDEIERLHQGISQFEDVIASGEVPVGMEDVFQERLERLRRDLTHAERQLEKCVDATRRASEAR